MGCGKSKSKQDVATGNTVVTTRKNSFKNNTNAEDPKKISKDRETIQEKPTTTNDEIIGNTNQGDDHVTEKVTAAAAPEVKEISENRGLLENHQEEETVESTVAIDRDEENEGNGVVPAAAAADVVEGETLESAGERLISRDSPNHYFSSRKDEEAVGSVVSEISTEYDSPSHDNVKEEGLVLKESEKAGEVAVDEIQSEIINGEPATINKDSLIKEVESATTATAPVASTTDVQEKDAKVGDEEHLTESSQPKI